MLIWKILWLSETADCLVNLWRNKVLIGKKFFFAEICCTIYTIGQFTWFYGWVGNLSIMKDFWTVLKKKPNKTHTDKKIRIFRVENATGRWFVWRWCSAYHLITIAFFTRTLMMLRPQMVAKCGKSVVCNLTNANTVIHQFLCSFSMNFLLY